MDFKASVIIPVYNAEKYVRQAVESAINLQEVGEIIIVEDGSPDNALMVCQQLEQEYAKVKVVQHPGGKNRGVGESRNLGIRKASCEFIAFLDADDYFLPHRFDVTKKVFRMFPETQGVYEAVGYFTESHADQVRLYTVSKSLKPTQLFHYLLRGTYGHFSTIGVTVKKSIFETSGDFNSNLRLHQDTELWLRMAFHGNLRDGEINRPVAMARRHDNNRITKADSTSKLVYLKIIKQYFSTKNIGVLNRLLIDRKIAQLTASQHNTSFYIEWIRQFFSR